MNRMLTTIKIITEDKDNRVETALTETELYQYFSPIKLIWDTIKKNQDRLNKRQEEQNE